MHRFLYFLFILAVLTSVPEPAFAQQSNKKFSYRESQNILRNMKRADKIYEEYMRYIRMEGRGNTTDYANVLTLRSYYPQTSFYNPDSDALVDQLMEFAFRFDTAEDPVQGSLVLVEYNEFLQNHMLDIKVLFMAKNLSRQDASFGNTMFFDQLIGILEKMITPELKKGEQPEDAFMVANFGEITFITQSLGVKTLNTETYEPSPGLFYEVRNIRNLKTGEEYPLFFDISIPLKALGDQKVIEKDKRPVVPKL